MGRARTHQEATKALRHGKSPATDVESSVIHMYVSACPSCLCRDQRRALMSAPSSLSYILVRQDLTGCRLAARKCPSSSASVHTAPQLQACAHAKLFMWVMRIQTQVLILAYPLSHLPSPSAVSLLETLRCFGKRFAWGCWRFASRSIVSCQVKSSSICQRKGIQKGNWYLRTLDTIIRE